MSEFAGLKIIHHGHETRLKWHQLRRQITGALFSLDVLRDGLALGASMELDLCARADGGFVVLHDNVLEGETDHFGPVAARTREELADVRLRDSGNPLIFSEDLPELLQQAHPDALLQLDIKDDLALVGEVGLHHLESHLAGVPAGIIIGCMDLKLIETARRVAPSLQRGIDPSDDMAGAARSGGIGAAVATLAEALDGETDASTVYLHWQLILAAAEQDADLVDMCHAHGKLVDAWTFNLKHPDAGFTDAEWAAFKKLIDMRVDQITTDAAPATEAAWHQRMQAA